MILALRRIIEEVKKNNLTAVLCFIDFKKSYDSIHRAYIYIYTDTFHCNVLCM